MSTALVSRTAFRSHVLLQHLRSLSVAPAATGPTQDEVLTRRVDTKRIITLNRPHRLNALNLKMIRLLYPKIQGRDDLDNKSKWDDDPELNLVIIKGAGDRAFCAGGDVKDVAKAGKEGDPKASDFFREEYKLNNRIGTMHIPFIAFIDGITMGGGVGLSIHGSFRVATERTLFAMPETGIGLFPDIGGSFFLPRLGGKLGLFLALTGYRLHGRDIQKAGVATHFIESEKLPLVEKDLLTLRDPKTKDVAQVLDSYHNQCQLEKDKEFCLQPYMDKINHLFSAPTMEQIFQNLQNDGSSWSLEQLAVLKKMSPMSLKVTLKQLEEGYSKSLQECLKMEFRLAVRTLQDHDFYEGVRAVLIDKDNNPKWKPATLEEISETKVASYFELLPPDQELKL